MDAIRGAGVPGGVEPTGGEGGGPPLHMKFSRDAAISRIPAPHLLKQGQLQLAGASFRDFFGTALPSARGAYSAAKAADDTAKEKNTKVWRQAFERSRSDMLFALRRMVNMPRTKRNFLETCLSQCLLSTAQHLIGS